jgi:hypothetical protein
VPLPTGVSGHSTGQPIGKIGVRGMEGQERDDRPQETFKVLGMRLFTATGIGFLLLCETLGGSLGVQGRQARRGISAKTFRIQKASDSQADAKTKRKTS